MQIRYILATDDRNEISKIYEESWRYAYKGIIPQDYLDSIAPGTWAKNFDNPGWNTAVCIENGKYVGTSSFCKSRFEKFSDCGEVISIYFLPEYMGKGYGKRLLDFVFSELKKQGFSEALLWVLEENDRARKFYERNGLQKAEDYIESTIGGNVFREIRYSISLM